MQKRKTAVDRSDHSHKRNFDNEYNILERFHQENLFRYLDACNLQGSNLIFHYGDTLSTLRMACRATQCDFLQENE